MLAFDATLYKALWGIDPVCSKRQTLHDSGLLLPSLYYLFVWIVITVWLRQAPGSIHANILISTHVSLLLVTLAAFCIDFRIGSFVLLSWLLISQWDLSMSGWEDEELGLSVLDALLFTGASLHLLRLLVSDDLRRFRHNWLELRLAGITAKDYLWSHARLGVVSQGFVCVLSATALLAVGQGNRNWLLEDDAWVMVLLCFVEMIFVLTGGVLVDVAAWTRSGRYLKRLFSLFLMILVGPAGVLVILSIVCEMQEIYFNPYGPLIVFGPLATVIGTFLRLWYIRLTWQRAILRLEGELMSPFV